MNFTLKKSEELYNYNKNLILVRSLIASRHYKGAQSQHIELFWPCMNLPLN